MYRYANFTTDPHRPRRSVYRSGRGAGGAWQTNGKASGRLGGLCGRGHAHRIADRSAARGPAFLRQVSAASGLRRGACDTDSAGHGGAGLLGKLLPEESELAARFGQGRDPARAAAMRTALITGAALLLHNFPEGVLTFFAGTADPALGLRTAAAIALHNIPEGLAVAVPFAYATRSRAAGVLAALVSGLAEPLGGCAGVVVPAPVFYTRLFERHGRVGGRHYGVGVLCPAFARCVRP